jgi:hypothetical protein
MCNLPSEVRAGLYGVPDEPELPADDVPEEAPEDAWQTV